MSRARACGAIIPRLHDSAHFSACVKRLLRPPGSRWVGDRAVVGVQDRLDLKWTFIGAHAVNAYARPRATLDIDLAVEGRALARVVRELESEFGDLETTDLGAALRVINLSLDLARGDNHPLFRAALDQSRRQGEARVPPPELLVALTFLAAVSPWRKTADRKQDAADLVNVYRPQATGSIARQRSLTEGRPIRERSATWPKCSTASTGAKMSVCEPPQARRNERRKASSVGCCSRVRSSRSRPVSVSAANEGNARLRETSTYSAPLRWYMTARSPS